MWSMFTLQISIKIPNLQLCCWLLLGYVFAHWVNGSGGGKYCGVLNKLANRDSNVSPEWWWWLPLSPPLFPFPLFGLLFGLSEFLLVGGVGGLLPDDNDWWGLLDNIWLCWKRFKKKTSWKIWWNQIKYKSISRIF